MKQIAELPPAFKRYEEMRGALDFAVFKDAGGTREEILSAIPAALQRSNSFDPGKLRALGFARIGEQIFFGDWYDLETGHLLKVGNWTTADGRDLENPKLKDLDQVNVISGAAPCPEAGAGGQFAYAFTSPPYGLTGRPSGIQAVFDDIRKFVLPPNQCNKICDWSSPHLPEVSDYFIAGMEWWGVFLFSVYLPETGQLTIIAGSETD